MARRLNLRQDVKLHNKFHLVLTDSRTGEVKQEAWAYNIVLNSFFGRLFLWMQSTQANNISNRFFSINGVVGRTFIGGGTGVLSPERTTLFNYMNRVAHIASSELRGVDLDNSNAWGTSVATFSELMSPNSTITEVGLGGDGESLLRTHALIEDSEGNPITVAKGEFDILTVYSTVYIELGHGYGSNIVFPDGTGVGVSGAVSAGVGNYFFASVANNTQASGAHGQFWVGAGTDNTTPTKNDNVLGNNVAGWAGSDWAKTDVIFNSGQKKIDIYRRFAANETNYPLWEIGVCALTRGAEFFDYNFATGGNPIFRSVMPIATIWEGYDNVGEEIGTGDGTQTVFNLQWAPIVAESDVIKVDGVIQTRGTDYTIDNATGAVTFTTAPANGLAILADYSILFIPKDENHVLDVGFTIQFADGNI